MLTKVCTNCKEEKTLDGFYKHKAYAMGVMSTCKECRKEYKKSWRVEKAEEISTYYKGWRDENKEWISSYNVNYWKNCSEEVKERRRKRQQNNYLKNLDVKRQKGRDYYSKNKERAKNYYQTYKVGKEAYFAERVAARHAKKKSQIPKHLVGCKKERKRLQAIYDLSKMVSDHSGVMHHVDHMWPLADGGPHWSGNLQIIPAEDNLKKSASVCEDIKKTVQESLAWEIQRHNETKSTTKRK